LINVAAACGDHGFPLCGFAADAPSEATVMTAISPIKCGLVLGAVIGLWHLTWSLMVALGWAQRLIDFVFWMHFIKPIYGIDAFNPTTAIVLIAVTSAMGFVIGAVFGVVWNWFHNRR
jgi:hypothetical protein